MLSIPLQITSKGILREESVERSIDKSLTLLLQTPCYECKADPQYGFIFKNLRFEIFNENEGTINNPLGDSTASDSWLYKKKVSGTSKNINTFASELQNAVTRYEPRLSKVIASLTYVREEKNIYVSVKGVITATNTPYQYKNIIRVWN